MIKSKLNITQTMKNIPRVKVTDKAKIEAANNLGCSARLSEKCRGRLMGGKCREI